MRFSRVLSVFGCLLVMSSAVHATLVYQATMTGANEVPATVSTATGYTSVVIEDNLMKVHVDWTGLVAPASAAHIHCCTPLGSNIGVAVGFGGFPATQSGVFEGIFDLLNTGIYTASFLANFGGGTAAGARDALIAGLDGGRAYSNIHNSVFPDGEIRGNLVRVVAEPAMTWLLVAGCGIAFVMRRRLLEKH